MLIDFLDGVIQPLDPKRHDVPPDRTELLHAIEQLDELHDQLEKARKRACELESLDGFLDALPVHEQKLRLKRRMEAIEQQNRRQLTHLVLDDLRRKWALLARLFYIRQDVDGTGYVLTEATGRRAAAFLLDNELVLAELLLQVGLRQLPDRPVLARALTVFILKRNGLQPRREEEDEDVQELEQRLEVSWGGVVQEVMLVVRGIQCRLSSQHSMIVCVTEISCAVSTRGRGAVQQLKLWKKCRKSEEKLS